MCCIWSRRNIKNWGVASGIERNQIEKGQKRSDTSPECHYSKWEIEISEKQDVDRNSTNYRSIEWESYWWGTVGEETDWCRDRKLQRTQREQTREKETSECRSIGWNEERVGVWMGGPRWIKREAEGECRRRERQSGWEQFLAEFGSRSVLLPSSWTSLVAGVNYWDCTHTHTRTWVYTHTYERALIHTTLRLTQPVIQGHLALLVWTSRERGRWCQTDRKTEMERAHTRVSAHCGSFICY